MRVTERTRRRLVVLLVGAIGALVVRIAALRFGASEAVGIGLYAVAVACLVGCVLLILQGSR
jgi:type IV secretory pathway protease TraF